MMGGEGSETDNIEPKDLGIDEKNAFADRMKEGGLEGVKGKYYLAPPGTRFFIDGAYKTFDETLNFRVESIDYRASQITFAPYSDKVAGTIVAWIGRADLERVVEENEKE